MTTTAKLSSTHINSIIQSITETINVNGLVNESDEEQRLAFLFGNNTDLNNAISNVLFSKPYDEEDELSINHTNEFNLYKLFFKGIGENHFFFNESTLIDDIRESETLSDFCQRDHAYQQNAFAQINANFQKAPYIFSCDYWIRYINNSHELVYSTLRSADMDLYWQLDELSTQLIERTIPHSIDMKTFEADDEENTPVDIIVDADGKEQQLMQLKEFCLTCINELTQTYQKQLANLAPSISMRYEDDELSDQYVIFVINNEQAAKQVALRKFEKSVNNFIVPAINIQEQHLPFLTKFKRLFTAQVEALLETKKDKNNE